MRGFFCRGVYNGIETQPGGGEDVQEQEMIAQLLQKDERGMEALLLHYGPLMRYIIAPILPDPQDREECLSEVSMRVWSRVAQFDPRELDRVADGDHPKHGAKLSAQRAAPPRHAVYPRGHTGAGRLPRGSDFAGGAQRRRAQCAGPALARGPGAVLPKVLLLTVHRADRVRAGHDRPGRRGQALSPEKAAAQDVGR